MNKKLNYIITPDSISVITDKVSANIPSTHPKFLEIKEFCQYNKPDEIDSLLNSTYLFPAEIKDTVTVENNELIVGGMVVPDTYVKIFNGKISNFDKNNIRNILKMFEQCEKHSVSFELMEQIYNFIKHNGIKIDARGNIIAYKYVSKITTPDSKIHYVDSYTKSIKQNKGDYVTMARDKVNKDPEVACSTGLHAGSIDYVLKYGGKDPVAIVLINPKDIVSVPKDYNGQKLRCCCYFITDIYENYSKSTLIDKVEELI